MDKKSGSGMNNRESYESLEIIFWVKMLNFFDADPRSRMVKIQIRDEHPHLQHWDSRLKIIW
jgi:hypothetical protein